MREIKVIKLIHDVFNRADFVYLSEFFRFLGIYVCEDIVEAGSYSLSSEVGVTDCDFCIYIGDERTIPFGAAIPLYGELCDDIEPGNLPMIRSGEEVQKRVLYSVVKRVWDASEDELNDKVLFHWSKLIDIYVECKLAFHSINLQYYPKISSRFVADAKEGFLAGYNQINIIENHKDNYHMYYALLWCKVKTNLACDYMDSVTYFFVEDLTKECQTLCDAYPDRSNAKVLRGLSYEPFKGYASDALLALSAVLPEIRDKCYSSSVYYWIGKWYEYCKRPEEMERGYSLANKKKVKYRNYFKLAIAEKGKKNYEAALELFGKLLSELAFKLEKEFADPLELEYIFKTYAQICNIHYENGAFHKTIEYGNKAITFFNDMGKQKYFQVLYGEEANTYIEVTKERLKLVNIYWFLAGAYRGLGQDEKANHYQDEMIKLQNETTKSVSCL